MVARVILARENREGIKGSVLRSSLRLFRRVMLAGDTRNCKGREQPGRRETTVLLA